MLAHSSTLGNLACRRAVPVGKQVTSSLQPSESGILSLGFGASDAVLLGLSSSQLQQHSSLCVSIGAKTRAACGKKKGHQITGQTTLRQNYCATGCKLQLMYTANYSFHVQV
jgi:hypothetical protein